MEPLKMLRVASYYLIEYWMQATIFVLDTSRLQIDENTYIFVSSEYQQTKYYPVCCSQKRLKICFCKAVNHIHVLHAWTNALILSAILSFRFWNPSAQAFYETHARILKKRET